MDWQDLARRQAGTIGRNQLRRCGVTEPAVKGLVSRAQLREILPAVYSPRPVPGSLRQRLWAAAIWSDGGVISHTSAASVWGLVVEASTVVHVTVPDRRFRQVPPGLRLHRVALPCADAVPIDGLPVTTRARTVVDLLRTERYSAARDLRDRAMQQGWATVASLRRSIDQQPGRTGNAQLRRLVAEVIPGAQAESERRLHRILRTAGLTGWVAQHRVRLGGRSAYIDVAFPALRIAIEVDGRRWHDGAATGFEDDRARQNDLIAAGWRVLRFTWAMIEETPDLVVARIVQLLAA